MKGIIVMDIPENCRECKLRTASGYCSLTHRDIFLYGVKGEKANWCPIRPIPKRKPLTGDVSNYEKLGQELIRVGWNNCLDEMGL